MLAAEAEVTVARSATTVCTFCGLGCSMVFAGAATYPRLRHPVSQGALCLRGYSVGELGRSPLRVLTAYARGRGEPLRPLSPESAIAA